MNCYYNRKDFIASHILFEYIYILSRPHLQGGVKEKIKLLLILTSWGEHPDYL